jgi:DNA-binding XRE family transcriptional regulator
MQEVSFGFKLRFFINPNELEAMNSSDHRLSERSFSAGLGFGNVLRRLRLRAGLSQKNLAAAAGVTQQCVSRLETGCGQPNWNTARRLASALGTDPTAFLADEG